MRCKQNAMQTNAMHTRDWSRHKCAQIEYLRQVYVFLLGSYAFPEEMEQTKTLNCYLDGYKSCYEQERIPNKNFYEFLINAY